LTICVVQRSAPEAASVPVSELDFLRQLSGPTILRLEGTSAGAARVVAGLIHGNEPSGLRAMHRYLREGHQPAVDTYFFVGAVEAALREPAFSLRMLPGGRDLNRCFRAPFDAAEGEVAQTVLELLKRTEPAIVVDLHNNTGHNPAYVVTSSLDPLRLAVGSLFATRFVHSRIELGTFSQAFDASATSLTVECGMAGSDAADATAFAGLMRCLREPQLAPLLVTQEHLSLLVDPVRVRLRDGLSLAFAPSPRADVDVTFDSELDRHNFETLAPGTQLGWLRPQTPFPLQAVDEQGRDRALELFEARAGVLQSRRSFVPIMMTTQVPAALADCLFYAAEREQ
jgi:succinylglutamate desuccinylase